MGSLTPLMIDLPTSSRDSMMEWIPIALSLKLVLAVSIALWQKITIRVFSHGQDWPGTSLATARRRFALGPDVISADRDWGPLWHWARTLPGQKMSMQVLALAVS